MMSVSFTKRDSFVDRPGEAKMGKKGQKGAKAKIPTFLPFLPPFCPFCFPLFISPS
jgi:hypothetical protein